MVDSARKKPNEKISNLLCFSEGRKAKKKGVTVIVVQNRRGKVRSCKTSVVQYDLNSIDTLVRPTDRVGIKLSLIFPFTASTTFLEVHVCSGKRTSSATAFRNEREKGTLQSFHHAVSRPFFRTTAEATYGDEEKALDDPLCSAKASRYGGLTRETIVALFFPSGGEEDVAAEEVDEKEQGDESDSCIP